MFNNSEEVLKYISDEKVEYSTSGSATFPA